MKKLVPYSPLQYSYAIPSEKIHRDHFFKDLVVGEVFSYSDDYTGVDVLRIAGDRGIVVTLLDYSETKGDGRARVEKIGTFPQWDCWAEYKFGDLVEYQDHIYEMAWHAGVKPVVGQHGSGSNSPSYSGLWRKVEAYDPIYKKIRVGQILERMAIIRAEEVSLNLELVALCGVTTKAA